MKDPVLEDLKSITEDDLKSIPNDKKFKKVAWIVITIFLVFVVLIYVLPGNVLSVIEGLLESAELSKDFTVELDNNETVVFNANVYNKLKRIYLENQKTEIKICLIGSKENNYYYINDLYIPKTFAKSVFSVSSELCNKNTIISLHTHPYTQCLASAQDLNSHKAFKKVNPDGISGLMCEINRFSFYGY